MPTTQLTLDTDAIAKLEAGDVEALRKLSLDERGKLLAAACRTAVAIEANRIKMGMPPTEPAPWPQSTWNFLGECARRVRVSKAMNRDIEP
jgi:hypothetical protein